MIFFFFLMKELKNIISQKLYDSLNNLEFILSKKQSVAEITLDRLLNNKPEISNSENIINLHSNSIRNSFIQILEKSYFQINSLENSLRTLNPENVLNRGYSIVSNKKDNQLITKIDHLKVGDLLSITIKNGELEAKTTKINNKKTKENYE